MMIPLLLFAAQAAAVLPDAHDDEEAIVVTAALAPVPRAEAPGSVAIIERERIEALATPLALDLLRLAPGVSVASSGPPGSQAQVRIRGAEANHTLLLVDGIRFNDPASGNEARFELLSGAGAGRIEIVRGPQSALYGAEAIGGVVAVETGRRGTGASALAEAGPDGFRQFAGDAGVESGSARIDLYGGHQRSSGIDSFGIGGERDGYANLTMGGRASAGDPDRLSLIAVGRFTAARSQFDGFDPLTFARTDTRDETRNQIGAGRIAARYRDPGAAQFSAELGATLLASVNRNRLGGAELNRTRGRRLSLDARATASLATGAVAHRLTMAGDYESERFLADDSAFGGATAQRRERGRGAVTAGLNSRLKWLTTDIALRRDSFEGFADATTVRAAAVVRFNDEFSLLAGYGTGIARPTFFDLFGFFPGSFVGNPDLRTERSRGGEIALRYTSGRTRFAMAAYSQQLRDEIVDVFDPVTFGSSTANASGASRRRGVEIEGGWRPLPFLSIDASYAYTDTRERTAAGAALVKEVRRPKHSASLSANARWARITAGGSLAYIGSRSDTDFSAFPAAPVRLGKYLIADARFAYRLARNVELFARVSNAFDADYQDVVGYFTQGRTVHGGIRLRYGD